jgi:site-specific DNA-methyltransferase (adenine-specific)
MTIETIKPALPRPYYDRGGITVYHGDALEILPALDLSAPFSVVTDPPYGTGWLAGGGSVGEFKATRSGADWDVWDVKWMEFLKGAQSWAVFCPDPRVVDLGVKLGKFSLRYYVKTNPRPPLQGRDAPSVEPCVVSPRVRFSKGPSHREAYNGDAVHPCQKPELIMRWLVHDTTAPDEVVIDPFMGSGTTLRAAKDLNRRAIGIEREEKYCEIAVRRLGQEVLFQ